MSFSLFFKTFFKHNANISFILLGLSLCQPRFYYMTFLLLICDLLTHYYSLKDPLFLLNLNHPEAKTYLTGKFLTNKFIDKKIKNADIYVKSITGYELLNILKHYDVKHIFRNKETCCIERITIYYNNIYIEFSTIPDYGYSKITNMMYKINSINNIYDNITIENIENLGDCKDILTLWAPHNKNFKFNDPLQMLKIFKDVSFWDLNIDDFYYGEAYEYFENCNHPEKKLNNVIMFDELYKFINGSSSHIFIEKFSRCGGFEMLNTYYLNAPIKISDNLKEKLKINNDKFMIFLLDVAEQNNMELSEWVSLNNFNPSKVIDKYYLKYSCLFSKIKNEYINIKTDYDFLIFLNKHYTSFYKLKKICIKDILKSLDNLDDNCFITEEKMNSILHDYNLYPLCQNELFMPENDILHKTYKVSYANINEYKNKALLKIYRKELQNEYVELLKDFEREFM